MKINSKLLTKKTDSKTLTIGNVGIEWGTVNVAPSNGSSPNYYGSVQVNFKHEYISEPSMIACGGVGYTSINNVCCISVGTTSGNVWVSATSTTSRSYRYLVIGFIS